MDRLGDDALQVVRSRTFRVPFQCGTLYLVVDDIAGRPVRVFLKKGHTGLCNQGLLEAIGRVITINLQSADPQPDRIQRTLIGITCENSSPVVGLKVLGGQGALSCVDAVAKLLKMYYPQPDVPAPPAEPEELEDVLCPPTD